MCMYTNMETLKTYVSRRPKGKNPVAAMVALSNTTRDTGLNDSQHLARGGT